MYINVPHHSILSIASLTCGLVALEGCGMGVHIPTSMFGLFDSISWFYLVVHQSE